MQAHEKEAQRCRYPHHQYRLDTACVRHVLSLCKLVHAHVTCGVGAGIADSGKHQGAVCSPRCVEALCAAMTVTAVMAGLAAWSTLTDTGSSCSPTRNHTGKNLQGDAGTFWVMPAMSCVMVSAGQVPQSMIAGMEC